MKILLANPAHRISLGNGLERYFFCAGSRCPWSLVKGENELPRYAMYPFMMGYAAALLEDNNYEVAAIDAIPLNLSESDFLEQALEIAPDLILFEPVTTSLEYISGIAEILAQETKAKIVFAGSHVSALPEETLIHYPVVDYILRGEYEYSLLELVKALDSDKPTGEIEGIAYLSSEDKPVIKEKASVKDVNSLPFPARHLFPSGRINNLGLYHDGFCQNRPAIQMHSSRGCPFQCKFCLWTQVIYNQGRYRIFSPDRVVEEMLLLRDQYNAKEIYIDDDTFTGNKEHVLEICRLIAERELNIPWSAMGDAMLCDEEMIVAMKKSGCIGIKFGLESANAEVLKEIKKPLNPEKLSKLVKLCNKLRIKTHVSVSFGHLNETLETVKETMDFALALPSDSIQFSIATPYPGTSFYDEADKLGLISKISWSEYDPTHNSIVNLPGIGAEELKQIEAKAHGLWLRKKITNLPWLFRQSYFLFYLMKRQGFRGFLKRAKRGIQLLFSKKFR